MTDNPLDPINKLAQRLGAEAAKLGLHLEHFLVAAMTDPPSAQCIFTIDPSQLGRDDEQAKFDAEFEEMMREQAAATRDEKTEATRNQMLEHLRKLRGDDA